jgi:hypothetical protein
MIVLALAAAIQPTVIFSDGFENGILNSWGDRKGTMEIVTDDPYQGEHCIKFTGEIGTGEGSKLVQWFMPGYDEIAIKWAVKFADDFDQGRFMHLCAVGGNRTDNKWSSFGKAGLKPNGTDFFITNLEPWLGKNSPPGRLMTYSYWPDMKKSGDGKYWGNMTLSNPPIQVPRDKWVVMSLWIKLNTPGKHDGEQAFWMDGKLGGHDKGIRYRDSNILKLNSLFLDLYLHDSKQINVCWFDDVVVSREPFAWMKDIAQSKTQKKTDD